MDHLQGRWTSIVILVRLRVGGSVNEKMIK